MARTVVRQAPAFACQTIARQTIKTGDCGAKATGLKVRMLPSLLVLVAILGKSGWAECLQAQHLQELQQPAAQPQSLEQNPASQNAYYGDYAQLVADNLINLGQPYFNNKRARKMSAFMPMRGRKDGRDAHRNPLGQPAYEGSSNSALDGELSASIPFRETDGGEASILRLVRASMAAGGPDGTLQWTGAPAPSQFANQLAARHMLLAGPMMHQLSPMGPIESTDGYSFGSGEPTALMQAKPRRAFHPMRGKKSESMFDVPDLELGDIE